MILEIFPNKRGKYQVRQKASNGKILMHSEEYASKSNALRMATKQASEFKIQPDIKVLDKRGRWLSLYSKASGPSQPVKPMSRPARYIGLRRKS